MRPMQEQPGGAESQCHEASDRTPGYSHGKRPQAFRDMGPDKPSSTPPVAEYGREEGRRPPAVGRLARAGNPASRTVQRNASWRGDQPGLCADKECRGRGRGQPEGQAAGAAAGRLQQQGSCGARPWPAGRGGGRLNAAGVPKIRRCQAWERSGNSIKIKVISS